MLVNDCEKKCLKLKKEERVYSVFANKKTENKYFSPINGANISTSKVAILFSFIITISWGILLLKEFMKFIDDRCLSIVLHILGVILIPIITLSLSYISQLFLQSKIDHFPDLKLQQTKED